LEKKKRKDIIAKEAKATKSIRAQYDKLKAARKNAVATWEGVQKTQKELSQVGENSPKGQKLVPMLKKQLVQCKKDFQIFEKFTTETFGYAQEYFNITIPDLLKQMEEIEKERLQLLKAQLVLFAKLYNLWDNPTSPGNIYIDTATALDQKSDLHKCIVAKVSEYGMPQGPPELPPALPCSSNDFDNDNWKTPKSPELPQFDVKNTKDIKSSKAISPKNYTSTTHPPPPSSSSSASSSTTSTVPIVTRQTSDVTRQTSDDDSTKEEGEVVTPADTKTESTETTESSAPKTEETTVEPEGPVQFARAIYDYSTDHGDDLQFKVGDIIRLVTPNVEFSTHDPNNPVWLLGELRDNAEKTGSFPSNYVEEYKPETTTT